MTAAGYSPIAGDSRARMIIVFQLFLAAVIVLVAALALLSGLVLRPNLLVGSLALTFATSSAAFLLPWADLPSRLALALPGLDALAIALLRGSSPEAGTGLLWVFPAMWVAWSFTLLATIITVSAITIGSWVQAALNLSTSSPLSALLVPLTIGVVATLTQIMSRRVGAQRDLLERQSRSLRYAVERTRRQEGLLTDVLDAVDFEVVVYGTDGTLVVSNAAHARFREIREQAGAASYAADGISSIDPAALPMARAERGATFERELHWYGAPGQDRRALETTSRRLRDWRGQSIGVLVVTRDVTAEVLAVRAREDLVASVSHELRTPLTSILGFLELAGDSPDLPDRTRRGLQIAERNADRLLALIADILTASAAAGEGIALSVDPEPGQVADVMLAAVDAAGESAAARGMTIDTAGVEPAVARIDAHRVRQVLDNLISNAIKYGDNGGRIEVGTTSDGVHAWLVVRDDGPGMPESELPRLFDRFFRSDRVRHTSVHGSGLGLAISRDIVRAHGGDITVRSQPGQGATFIVRLPAVPATREDGHGETAPRVTAEGES